MPKLLIRTTSGHVLTAPYEAWIVAVINALPPHLQKDVFQRVAQLNGATLLPDKYLIGEDELGTITMIENPTVELKGL